MIDVPKFFFAAFSMFYSQMASATMRDSIHVSFSFYYGDDLLIPGKMHSDGTTIEFCKLYLTHVELINRSGNGAVDKEKVHLIDLTSEVSQSWVIENHNSIEHAAIRFDLGIDSVLNTLGVFGGSLDPTNGMYWTWQSGYINFKLEGIRTSESGVTESFQFHLGGYRFPFNTLRSVSYNTSDHLIHFGIDVKYFLECAEEKGIEHVMSPGENAMEMTEVLEKSIFLSQ